jgi:hypothetical protein
VAPTQTHVRVLFSYITRISIQDTAGSRLWRCWGAVATKKIQPRFLPPLAVGDCHDTRVNRWRYAD